MPKKRWFSKYKPLEKYSLKGVRYCIAGKIYLLVRPSKKPFAKLVPLTGGTNYWPSSSPPFEDAPEFFFFIYFTTSLTNFRTLRFFSFGVHWSPKRVVWRLFASSFFYSMTLKKYLLKCFVAKKNATNDNEGTRLFGKTTGNNPRWQ